MSAESERALLIALRDEVTRTAKLLERVVDLCADLNRRVRALEEVDQQRAVAP